MLLRPFLPITQGLQEKIIGFDDRAIQFELDSRLGFLHCFRFIGLRQDEGEFSGAGVNPLILREHSM